MTQTSRSGPGANGAGQANRETLMAQAAIPGLIWKMATHPSEMITVQKKNDRAPMTKLLPRRLAAVALYAAACLSVLLLASQITLYCDDYRYSTFFRDGWSGFWELTRWHYLNFNGRAFVHFVAELVLVFGTKLYVVLLPLMLSCLFLLGGRVLSREASWTALLFSGAAGVMAVAALPVEFLSSSLLWIAASFNYLFPLCVLLWALWWEEKFFPKKILPLLLLSLLSGATTEQSGLAGIVCLGGWGLLAWLRKKAPLWKSLLPGLCAGLGYLTVVLAPGTRVRIGTEVGSSVLALLRPEALGYQFTQALRYFSGPDGLPQLVEGFALLSAVHALVKKGPRPLLSGFLAAPVYAVLFRLETYWLCDLVAVLYLMIAAVSYLRRPETTARGLLLLGLLASQLVMIFTYTVAYRTAMPAILLLLAVCVCLLAECLELLPLPAGELSCAALAAVLFLAFLPTYRGYAANALVFRANEAQLRDPDSDLAVLSLDLDLHYRHETYLDFPEYLDYALLCYGAEDKKNQLHLRRPPRGRPVRRGPLRSARGGGERRALLPRPEHHPPLRRHRRAEHRPPGHRGGAERQGLRLPLQLLPGPALRPRHRRPHRRPLLRRHPGPPLQRHIRRHLRVGGDAGGVVRG